MPKYIIATEIKDEILRKVKEGVRVADCAKQYGIHCKTIYGWLSNKARAGDPILEINRLKKENQGLAELVGLLAIAAAKQKKGLPPERWFTN